MALSAGAGHKLGIELVRERVKDQACPIQEQLLAAEILVRFWKLEAAHSGIRDADLETIESMAQYGAERVWDALMKVGIGRVH